MIQKFNKPPIWAVFFCAINPASLTDSHCSKSQKINSF
nr:MAG TPA: hypothetical protein [Caudoviricetes sp.]